MWQLDSLFSYMNTSCSNCEFLYNGTNIAYPHYFGIIQVAVTVLVLFDPTGDHWEELWKAALHHAHLYNGPPLQPLGQRQQPSIPKPGGRGI